MTSNPTTSNLMTSNQSDASTSQVIEDADDKTSF